MKKDIRMNREIFDVFGSVLKWGRHRANLKNSFPWAFAENQMEEIQPEKFNP